MTFSQGSTDEHYKGADDSLDANYYISAPTDVRTALQYTALTSITPASEGFFLDFIILARSQ